MRAVVQRVERAEVRVDGAVLGAIERGLLVFVGAGLDDDDTDCAALVDKLVGLRIFADEEGQMNRAVGEVGGGLLLVSQFTLFGDTRKGRRPSFVAAMAPAQAEALYDRVVALAKATGLPVATGRFRADMRVELVNDGPVTLLIDTKKLF